ncbi:MAG: VWA domain-containing protein [Bacteroidales bacterium]|nr:VWA domain-containing protein [Candidatus Equimonas faecalis]
MFQFAAPQYLFLLLIPAALLLLDIAMRLIVVPRREKRLADTVLLRQLTPQRSRVRPLLKRGLLLLALAVLAVVLARPQILGGGTAQDKRSGIEVVLMLDVSNSMLAGDVRPSRLERSKLLISTLIDRLDNDKVGLGVFAGEAYPLLPITNDFVSAKMFLDGVGVDMVSLQGTSLAAAIDLASKSFTQEKGVGKAIVVITDGEDHEEGAADAARRALKDGRRVYVLGVGSQAGGTIPTPDGPLCDQQGEVVLTRVNAGLGQEVAKAGGGMYIPVDNSNLAQDQLEGALRQLKQKESIVASDEAADEQFQAVALIALVLLILEILIMEVKNPLFRRVNIFGRKAALLLTVVGAAAFAATPAAAQTPTYRLVRQGNRAFQAKDYKAAEKCYLKALQSEPRNARARFNLADTYLSQENPQEALKHYAEAAKQEPNKLVRAMSYHNMGYVHHKQKQYDKAIDYYKEALRLNPADEDTRYNLALAQKQKKEQKQNQQQQQKQDKKQDRNRQKQDQDQQQQQQQPDQLSQENVDQLLQLSRQAENQTRRKLEQMQPRKKSLPKNW